MFGGKASRAQQAGALGKARPSSRLEEWLKGVV